MLIVLGYNFHIVVCSFIEPDYIVPIATVYVFIVLGYNFHNNGLWAYSPLTNIATVYELIIPFYNLHSAGVYVVYSVWPRVSNVIALQ